MWTYTAYIFKKYCEKKQKREIRFNEFAEFLFDVLWRKHHLVFHDGIEELLSDFRFLEKIGLVELSKEKDFDIRKITRENTRGITIKVVNDAKLQQVSKIVEDSPNATNVELLKEYNERIQSAIDEID